MSRVFVVSFCLGLWMLVTGCGPILSNDSSSSGSFAVNDDNLVTDPDTANVTSPAMYRDENFDGKINAGDTIELEFDRAVTVRGNSIELDFPVSGDSLGSVTSIRATSDPRRVRLVLDDNWAFRCRQQYNGTTTADSASALTVVRSDSIRGGAKNRAGRSPATDMQPAFLRDSRIDFDVAGNSLGPCRAVTAGDFDQDGLVDLATAFDGLIHIWQNQRTRFRVTHTVGYGSRWNSVHMVDLNQDGHADVAAVSDFEVGVWLYDPAKDRYAKLFRDFTVGGPTMAIGNLIGDSLPDLLIGATNRRLHIFRNNGAAGFNRVSAPSLAFLATDLLLADLDGDGDHDILAASRDSVQWWRNDNTRGSNGTLGGLAPEAPTATSETYAIVLADSDRDGRPDLFLGKDGPNEVWRNTSTTTAISFQPTAARLGNSDTRALASIDFDLDGHPDIVAGNANGQADHVWVHTGNLQFADGAQRLGTDSTLFLTAADFDGDGDDDLAAANESWNHLWRSSLAGATDSQSFQSGRFQEHSFNGRDTVACATGDLDLDGDHDLVCANGTGPRTRHFNSGNGRFQNGNNPFQSAAAPVNPDTRGVAIVDVNVDGRPDVVFANRAGPGAGAPNEVWLANAAGGFDFHVSLGDSASADVVAMDLNRDGFPDLVFASELPGEDSEVYLNQADDNGWFLATPSSTFESGTETVALAVGDLNRDSIPDVVTANQVAGGGAANHALLGDGNGNLIDTGEPFLDGSSEVRLHTTDVVLADMNRDGRLDALFSNRSIGGLSGATQLFLGCGDGGFVFLEDDGVLVQELVGLSLADMNFDGRPDLYLAHRGDSESVIPRDDAVRLNDIDGTWNGDPCNGGTWVGTGTAFGVRVDLGERRNSRHVLTDDVDGDGDPDFVIAVEDGSNQVFFRR